MKKVCCGFGHRKLFEKIDDELEVLIEELITVNNVRTFMTGDMGSFDKSFSAAVRKAKRKHKDIELHLVLPYFSNRINKDKNFYEELFDKIIIPEELVGVHYKRAITQRNKWMIDSSDYVLTCVCRKQGGAYTAMKYAKESGKLYKNILIK